MGPAVTPRFTKFFPVVGYAVFSLLLGAVLLELGAFVGWSAYHWFRPGPWDLVGRSPAYDGYEWAPEFWKEEKLRQKSRHAKYVPFRIWGMESWHSKYVNTDDTEMGTWRRTLNPRSERCEKQATTKVWVLGGSTVYGAGVPDWATLPSYLSQELNRGKTGCVVVANLGVEAYVTSQEVILLIEQLKRGWQPDIVIFYDGINDTLSGTVSPGFPGAPLTFDSIKARVEGSVKGRLDFLRSSYSLRLARTVIGSLRATGSAKPFNPITSLKAGATLDNYEANLRIVRALGEAYGFRVYCFWQPVVLYGHKALVPFEQELKELAGRDAGGRASPAFASVYDEAQRRAATSGSFVFLGGIFDSVKDPLYSDWMHLGPRGNELAAKAIASYISLVPTRSPKTSLGKMSPTKSETPFHGITEGRRTSLKLEGCRSHLLQDEAIRGVSASGAR